MNQLILSNSVGSTLKKGPHKVNTQEKLQQAFFVWHMVGVGWVWVLNTHYIQSSKIINFHVS